MQVFGQDGPTGSFGVFGSKAASAPANSKDVETIQSLQAWLDGWQSAIYSSNKAPFLEDLNSVSRVFAYQLAYVLQEGVPEWNVLTNYFIGSVVKKTGTSELYKSLTDNNLGNALPSKSDNAFWQYVINRGILQYDSTYSYSVGEIVQKAGTAELYQSLTSGNVGNALPNQTTTAIWKYLIDLANLAPPPTGIQAVKVAMAALSVTSTTTTSASVAKNPVADFSGFTSDMTIYAFVILAKTAISSNSGAAAPFSWDANVAATLSGSGVDSSGLFVAGGSAGTTYTFTLTFTLSTNIGVVSMNQKALVVFIGVK